MKHFEDSGVDLGVDVVVGSLDHFEASLVNPALPRLVRVDDLHMVYGRIESSTILKTSQTFPCRDAGQLVAAQPPLSPPPGRGRQSSFLKFAETWDPRIVKPAPLKTKLQETVASEDERTTPPKPRSLGVSFSGVYHTQSEVPRSLKLLDTWEPRTVYIKPPENARIPVGHRGLPRFQ